MSFALLTREASSGPTFEAKTFDVKEAMSIDSKGRMVSLDGPNVRLLDLRLLEELDVVLLDGPEASVKSAFDKVAESNSERLDGKSGKGALAPIVDTPALDAPPDAVL